MGAQARGVRRPSLRQVCQRRSLAVTLRVLGSHRRVLSGSVARSRDWPPAGGERSGMRRQKADLQWGCCLTQGHKGLQRPDRLSQTSRSRKLIYVKCVICRKGGVRLPLPMALGFTSMFSVDSFCVARLRGSISRFPTLALQKSRLGGAGVSSGV